MKKFMSFLIIFISFLLLSSCKTINFHNKHQDDNNDLICDICGYQFCVIGPNISVNSCVVEYNANLFEINHTSNDFIQKGEGLLSTFVRMNLNHPYVADFFDNNSLILFTIKDISSTTNVVVYNYYLDSNNKIILDAEIIPGATDDVCTMLFMITIPDKSLVGSYKLELYDKGEQFTFDN